MRSVNKYPKAFRQMAVERMRTCDNVSALARELGVDRTVLYHWRNLMPQEGQATPAIPSPVRELRKEIRDLKRVLAEKAMEVDFFKGVRTKNFIRMHLAQDETSMIARTHWIQARTCFLTAFNGTNRAADNMPESQERSKSDAFQTATRS